MAVELKGTCVVQLIWFPKVVKIKQAIDDLGCLGMKVDWLRLVYIAKMVDESKVWIIWIFGVRWLTSGANL